MMPSQFSFLGRALFCAFLFSSLLTRAASAEKLTPAPDGTFSIVVIPDTQAYIGAGTRGDSDKSKPVSNPGFFDSVRWIAANRERQKIAFVSHIGDLVDINEPRQWKVARECMDVIHGKIPYGIAVGCHDMTLKGDSSLFQHFFPRLRFDTFEWYGGAYSGSAMGPATSGNNANSYQNFAAEDISFVFLHLECNAPDDVLAWANDILDRHRDSKAFISSHMGWGPRREPKEIEEFIIAEKGRMEWTKTHGPRGNSPQQMWEKCYCKHPHLVAVFSGDQSRTQTYHAATPGEHGNVIHEFLQDYGGSCLRLYRFHPAKDRIQVITFDPKSSELCPGTKLIPDPHRHHFEVEASLLARP